MKEHREEGCLKISRENSQKKKNLFGLYFIFIDCSVSLYCYYSCRELQNILLLNNPLVCWKYFSFELVLISSKAGSTGGMPTLRVMGRKGQSQETPVRKNR